MEKGVSSYDLMKHPFAICNCVQNPFIFAEAVPIHRVWGCFLFVNQSNSIGAEALH